MDDFIRGELQAEELIVGQVLVECVHDPVAVSVGVRVAALFLEDVTFGVGVAGDIEPVTTPAFPEGWVCHEAVDKFFRGSGVLVGNEGGDFRCTRVYAPKR